MQILQKQFNLRKKKILRYNIMSAQDSVTSMSPGEFGEGSEGVMTGGRRRRRRSGVRRSRKTRGGTKKPMMGGKRRSGRRRKTRGGTKTGIHLVDKMFK